MIIRRKRASEALQEEEKKRRSRGGVEDVPEDASELISEAETSGISTELTRTHQLEAGRNRLAITTGNDGGRSTKPTEQD